MQSSTGLRHATLALCLLGIAGCVSAPSTVTIRTEYFNDALFQARPATIDAEAALALSPEMRAYTDEILNMNARSKPLNQMLLESLYSKGGLKLEYDASKTRNAAEAYKAKSGNCLSLVLMTSALAKQLGINVRYQSVFVADSVSRDENMLYFSDHVNLVLGKSSGDHIQGKNADTTMTVDFLRPADASTIRARTVSEAAILAMYMNNRAVEELVSSNLNEAYWWAKKSIETDATLLMSYNTLGLVYEHHKNLREAENLFRYVLGVEQDNHVALANLSRVLRKLGNDAEAYRLENRLNEMQPVAPFYYFDLGIQAMKSRDYEAARRHFTREINRAAYYHEFHFWLAQAYVGLKELSKARNHMQIAIDNAMTAEERERYTAALRQIQLSN